MYPLICAREVPETGQLWFWNQSTLEITQFRVQPEPGRTPSMQFLAVFERLGDLKRHVMG